MTYRSLGISFSASTNSPPTLVIPGGNTLQDQVAKLATVTQDAIDSGQIYKPASESTPRMVLPGAAPTGPKPVVYDRDGRRYTAVPGNYTGQDPANVYCQGGNTPPCACATQEAKDAIVNQGLCKVTSIPGPAVRGIGVSSVYSVYSVYTGRPEGAFKWYDKWQTSPEDFNPCDVLRLPTCKTDCNAPWFEPVRISGEYGYCKSTRVSQVASVYTPRTPVTTVPACGPGTHPSSGGCVKDVAIEDAPTPTASSSYMVGGLILLLLLGGGGAYYMSQKKAAKAGK